MKENFSSDIFSLEWSAEFASSVKHYFHASQTLCL